MKRPLRHCIGCAAATFLLALGTPALGAPVALDFEEPQLAADTLAATGQTIGVGHFVFEVGGAGFAAATTPASFDASQSVTPAAPLGNATQFLSFFGDAFVTMSHEAGRSFSVTSLDYAFLSPLAGVFGPDVDPGLFLAFAVLTDGTEDLLAWDFGLSDDNGEFGFFNLQGAALGVLAAGKLRQVSFGACTYDDVGDCTIGNQNFSQFAIDNIVAQVPAPASATLALSALLLLAAQRQRSGRTQH